ncbi:50S ribosomal protein L21 [Roseivivax sp. CAU 1761]
MFAVMKTGGKQYKVQSGDTLRVEKLAAAKGDKVQFNDILMLGGDETTFGAPTVAGAAVQAEVIDQIKGEKVIHFVRRRRKHSSKRTKGHRQQLTLVRVTDILASGAESSGVQAAIGAGAAGAAGLGAERHATNRAEQAEMVARAKGSEAKAKPAAEASVGAGAADDLKKLSGVGPALAKKLNEAGINTFAQIAAWTEDDLAKLDESIRNKAEKEGWVAQARDLAK